MSLKQIKELIKALPEKDMRRASVFLDLRNFDAIMELTDAAIYHAEKEILQDISKECDTNIDQLLDLKSAVSDYIIEEDYDEDYE